MANQKIRPIKAHGKEIDILSWTWGMSNSGSAHVGGGAGSGKVSVQDLSLTKYLDSSSAPLMLSCCNGSMNHHRMPERMGIRSLSTPSNMILCSWRERPSQR
jgi:hypothetical protein